MTLVVNPTLLIFMNISITTAPSTQSSWRTFLELLKSPFVTRRLYPLSITDSSSFLDFIVHCSQLFESQPSPLSIVHPQANERESDQEHKRVWQLHQDHRPYWSLQSQSVHGCDLESSRLYQWPLYTTEYSNVLFLWYCRLLYAFYLTIHLHSAPLYGSYCSEWRRVLVLLSSAISLDTIQYWPSLQRICRFFIMLFIFTFGRSCFVLRNTYPLFIFNIYSVFIPVPSWPP